MEDKKKELIRQLAFLNTCERYIIDRRLEDGGIHFGQPPILLFLHENPNATQKDIADSLHISPASVAVSVKRMEKAGIISRATDKDDARRNNLSLTKKGAELNEFAIQTFDLVNNAKLSSLSDDELSLMLSIAKKMGKNLSPLLPENCKRSFKQEDSDV